MSTRLVTFTLDGHLYGVDVDVVQEVLRGQPLSRIPLAPEAVAGLVNLRGQVLSTIDLRVCLDLTRRARRGEGMLVVARVAGEVVALLVDTIGAVVDVDDEGFETPPDTLAAPARDMVRGAYQLSDQLLLALDVERAVAG